MKFHISACLLIVLGVFSCNSSKNNTLGTNQEKVKVRGWNLLSNDLEKGTLALDKAKEYNINHLQLSHELIMDLKDVRNAKKLSETKKLIDKAEEVGIENILVWDHALYKLNYYPDAFKNEQGLINLDNPKFWTWLKNDYRAMLDSIPKVDGIVLTFIETGAHVEDQYSETWKKDSEKLANLVDSIASVVIDERKMQLYIRTFIYHKEELNALLECVNLVKHPKVKIMTKEVPHDFFLTHPVSSFIDKFDKDVIIEFDLGHEYNGQGIIASMLPEITVKRWKYYANKKNVIGYVARTDRYDDTQNIGRPTEINLYALKRIAEDTTLTPKTIVKEFIVKKYGDSLVLYLEDVFLETDDIITSVFYTLGLHMNSHSSFDFDYESIYSRHCSGKWLENPVAHVNHNVNKDFHYWKDVIEHLAPARYKSKEISPGKPSILYTEAPWVIDENLVTPVDNMNMAYLNDVIIEKEYGLQKATWALNKIREAKPYFKSESDYEELVALYERTQLTAELYYHSAKAYFGFRCYLNDGRSETLNAIIKEGLSGIKSTGIKMKAYPNKRPRGQYKWIDDVEKANDLSDKITNGWPIYGQRKFDF